MSRRRLSLWCLFICSLLVASAAVYSSIFYQKMLIDRTVIIKKTTLPSIAIKIPKFKIVAEEVKTVAATVVPTTFTTPKAKTKRSINIAGESKWKMETIKELQLPLPEIEEKLSENKIVARAHLANEIDDEEKFQVRIVPGTIDSPQSPISWAKFFNGIKIEETAVAEKAKEKEAAHITMEEEKNAPKEILLSDSVVAQSSAIEREEKTDSTYESLSLEKEILAPAGPIEPEQEVVPTKAEALSTQMVITQQEAAKTEVAVTKKEGTLSKTVLSAIKRSQKEMVSNQVAIARAEKVAASMPTVVSSQKDEYPLAKSKSKEKKDKEKKDRQGAVGFLPEVEEDEEEIKINASFSLRLWGVEAEGKKSTVSGFEFRKLVDQEAISDDAGAINIDYIIHGGHGQINGLIVPPSEYLPIYSSFAIAQSRAAEYSVPVFSQEYFSTLLAHDQLIDSGAHLLVELADNVLDVAIDSKSEKEIFFDESFIRCDQDRAAYKLFINVVPGNTGAEFSLAQGGQVQKVLFVDREALTYDYSEILESEAVNFSLYRKELLGEKLRELNIDARQLRYFGTNKEAYQLANNFYEITIPQMPVGFNRYVEFAQEEDNNSEVATFLNVGTGGQIAVPSAEFRDEIIKVTGINSLDGRCLIQVDFPKLVMSFKVEGLSARGAMSFKTMFLDNDGVWGEEVIENSRSAFLLGDDLGILNISVKYEDGSEDLIQSYCSENTHIIETL
ncbi:MAG: hypothetical protein A2504_06565 [Bdellovibrionales bacterium RIFOXYD12_FULL_39_22]|nr:MAG: hypothetical protein A2385_08885 [Bdellovibrionales bacterium RIFOXYB1_FULL_39_21]OFZ45185.1 MAG: hypothetical protein A2485_05650 [Bdellovibrionales bacterium RIFOXYC12_FULL_39_17]OFZ45623.1 MAG: hypothetical protein A2404_03465 [Bdellovibrionales bacterium RIFOXYC1_FULL_39_130]OFZ77485.1 MAG: hypothetical protein A2560_09055 [Bdellovibrionales bacterium RIFOXYD1_FULL_39_84]OFZ91614.1 MAG: hypothetical protein A2504_06565 [Bdellovibrionales bacterium RIFOXYD12_FULL_39_22]HLE11924.1 hy